MDVIKVSSKSISQKVAGEKERERLARTIYKDYLN